MSLRDRVLRCSSQDSFVWLTRRPRRIHGLVNIIDSPNNLDSTASLQPYTRRSITFIDCKACLT